MAQPSLCLYCGRTKDCSICFVPFPPPEMTSVADVVVVVDVGVGLVGRRLFVVDVAKSLRKNRPPPTGIAACEAEVLSQKYATTLSCKKQIQSF